MKRISSLLIVGIVVAGAFAVLAARAGAVTLPFGLEVPGISAHAAAPTSVLTLGTVYFEGAGTETSVTVGNGGVVRLSAGYGTELADSSSPTPHVTLERRVGDGTWAATAATVLVPPGKPLSVLTPVYATKHATATVQYRLASATSTSRTMRVVYENQSRYTGLAATIYRDLAKYCATSAVHVATLHGMEAGNYRTGALLIQVDRAVGTTTVVRAVDERALALHECSHERQWVDYGTTADGRKRMVAAAARYFSVPGNTIDPVEHAADCGAQSVNPGGYLGYGGTCTARQLLEGRRLLHGERY